MPGRRLVPERRYFFQRLALWVGSAALVLALDLGTKAAPHALVMANYRHISTAGLALVASFLCVFGLWYSRILAVGAGLMFGGLLGNGLQFLVSGYVSDWIPLAGWHTNVADIAGAIGLLCCIAGFVYGELSRRPVLARRRGNT